MKAVMSMAGYGHVLDVGLRRVEHTRVLRIDLDGILKILEGYPLGGSKGMNEGLQMIRMGSPLERLEAQIQQLCFVFGVMTVHHHSNEKKHHRPRRSLDVARCAGLFQFSQIFDELHKHIECKRFP